MFQNVPTLSSLPSTAKRGYLWKLSGRSILHKSQWKRKLFVLWKSRLYFYQGEGGGGDERGAGTINLKYFSSCVEAPLTDHKKATNVFILLAMEKGFLDQVRGRKIYFKTPKPCFLCFLDIFKRNLNEYYLSMV